MKKLSIIDLIKVDEYSITSKYRANASKLSSNAHVWNKIGLNLKHKWLACIKYS